jgi:hypothetical protein
LAKPTPKTQISPLINSDHTDLEAESKVQELTTKDTKGHRGSAIDNRKTAFGHSLLAKANSKNNIFSAAHGLPGQAKDTKDAKDFCL